jgi:RNA polymerase sigma factor (sigma-70 family)
VNNDELLKHTGLVVGMAARTRGAIVPGVTDMDDLVQDGWVGLLRTARRQGEEFTGGAHLQIRGEMLDRSRRLARHWSSGRDFKVLSLDATVSESSDSTFAEQLADTMAAAPDDSVEQKSDQALLQTALKTLMPRQRQIITMFYIDEMSHEAIGQQFGITEDAVKKAKFRAVDRLRAFMAKAKTGQAVTKHRRIVRPLRQCVECFAQVQHLYNIGLCRSCEDTRRNRLKGHEPKIKHHQCVTCGTDRRQGEGFVRGECKRCQWQTKKRKQVA